MVLTVHKF